MLKKIGVIALFVLLILSPACSGAKDLITKGKKVRWVTLEWCTDHNPEEPKKKAELEIRKGEILIDFRKIHPKW